MKPGDMLYSSDFDHWEDEWSALAPEDLCEMCVVILDRKDQLARVDLKYVYNSDTGQYCSVYETVDSPLLQPDPISALKARADHERQVASWAIELAEKIEAYILQKGTNE